MPESSYPDMREEAARMDIADPETTGTEKQGARAFLKKLLEKTGLKTSSRGETVQSRDPDLSTMTDEEFSDYTRRAEAQMRALNQKPIRNGQKSWEDEWSEAARDKKGIPDSRNFPPVDPYAHLHKK